MSVECVRWVAAAPFNPGWLSDPAWGLQQPAVRPAGADCVPAGVAGR